MTKSITSQTTFLGLPKSSCLSNGIVQSIFKRCALEKNLALVFLFASAAYAAGLIYETVWSMGLTVAGVVVVILVFLLCRILTVGINEVTKSNGEMILK
jgi:hypothetical protein